MSADQAETCHFVCCSITLLWNRVWWVASRCSRCRTPLQSWKHQSM